MRSRHRTTKVTSSKINDDTLFSLFMSLSRSLTNLTLSPLYRSFLHFRVCPFASAHANFSHAAILHAVCMCVRNGIRKKNKRTTLNSLHNTNWTICSHFTARHVPQYTQFNLSKTSSHQTNIARFIFHRYIIIALCVFVLDKQLLWFNYFRLLEETQPLPCIMATAN